MPVTWPCSPACLDVPVLQGWGSRWSPGLQLPLLWPPGAGNRHSSVCPGNAFSPFTQILREPPWSSGPSPPRRYFRAMESLRFCVEQGGVCYLRWNGKALTFQSHAKCRVHSLAALRNRQGWGEDRPSQGFCLPGVLNPGCQALMLAHATFCTLVWGSSDLLELGDPLCPSHKGTLWKARAPILRSWGRGREGGCWEQSPLLPRVGSPHPFVASQALRRAGCRPPVRALRVLVASQVPTVRAAQGGRPHRGEGKGGSSTLRGEDSRGRGRLPSLHSRQARALRPCLNFQPESTPSELALWEHLSGVTGLGGLLGRIWQLSSSSGISFSYGSWYLSSCSCLPCYCEVTSWGSRVSSGTAGQASALWHGSESGGSGGQGSCQRSGSLLPPLEAKCRFLLTQTTANYVAVSLSDTGT